MNSDDPYPPPLAPPASLPPATSGLAISSLVCGILGFMTLGITSLVGAVLGHLGLSRIRRSPETLSGRGLAIAGLVTSYLGILIFLAMVILPYLIFKFYIHPEEKKVDFMPPPSKQEPSH